MLRALRRFRPAIGAVLAAGCQSIVDPPLPSNAQQMVAPAVYSSWWAMTEACSGRTAPLSAVQWYQVPGTQTVPDPGEGNVAAYWSFASNRIVLSGPDVFDGPLVRHEMLHSLLQRGGHPRDDFVVRCAGVVDCVGQCLTDAGPAPLVDPTIQVVQPTALVLDLEVSPTAPSASTNDGFFEVTVSVTNPLGTPVRVSLPDSSRYNFGFGFGGIIFGPYGGESMEVKPTDISAVEFGPHERKIQVFDYRVAVDSAQGTWLPGAYQVTGEFGANRGARVTRSITLGP